MITEDQVQQPIPEQGQSITERNLDEAAKVRYLEPDEFALTRTPGGSLRMTLNDDRSVLRIKTRRCFPFAFPDKFISVRDANEEEIGIIRDLNDLSKEHRRWIEDDLEMRYYTPRVRSIKSIRQRWGGVEWHVTTDRGPKVLITRGVHDTMSEVEPGRYIITDVDGNRCELYAAELDEPSRARLDRLV